MLENAVVTLDRATLDPGQSAFEEQAAQDRAQEAEYRELRGSAPHGFARLPLDRTRRTSTGGIRRE
jgi:hypothetical protein